MRRTMWTLLAGAMLTMAAAGVGVQGSGACNRECLIGAVVISELFKIGDGRIRRIEAVMAGGLPLDATSGW
jgi:hypothetical protein